MFFHFFAYILYALFHTYACNLKIYFMLAKNQSFAIIKTIRTHAVRNVHSVSSFLFYDLNLATFSY